MSPRPQTATSTCVPATECSCARTKAVAAASLLTAPRGRVGEVHPLSVRDAFGWERIDPIRAARFATAHRRPSWLATAWWCSSGAPTMRSGKDLTMARAGSSPARIGGNLTGGVCAVCPPGAPRRSAHSTAAAPGTYSCWNDGSNADWHLWGQLGQRHLRTGGDQLDRRRDGCLLSTGRARLPTPTGGMARGCRGSPWASRSRDRSLRRPPQPRGAQATWRSSPAVSTTCCGRSSSTNLQWG